MNNKPKRSVHYFNVPLLHASDDSQIKYECQVYNSLSYKNQALARYLDIDKSTNKFLREYAQAFKVWTTYEKNPDIVLDPSSTFSRVDSNSSCQISLNDENSSKDHSSLTKLSSAPSFSTRIFSKERRQK